VEAEEEEEENLDSDQAEVSGSDVEAIESDEDDKNLLSKEFKIDQALDFSIIEKPDDEPK